MINQNNAYTAEDLKSAENNIFSAIEKTDCTIINNIGAIQKYILDKFSSFLEENERWNTEYSLEWQYSAINSSIGKSQWIDGMEKVLAEAPVLAVNFCNGSRLNEFLDEIENSKLDKEFIRVSIEHIKNLDGKKVFCVDYIADFICNMSIYSDDAHIKTSYIDVVIMQSIYHERRHSQQSLVFMSDGRNAEAYANMSTVYNKIPSEVDANAYGMRMALEYIKKEYNV